MTLDFAQDQFRSQPCNRHAADYLGALVTNDANDMIGAETLYSGIAEVRYWLFYGLQIEAA